MAEGRNALICDGLSVLEIVFYAEGVIARSPGLAMRSEASYPGSRSLEKVRYPEGVIADRKRVGNNAFSVEEPGGLNPG